MNDFPPSFSGCEDRSFEYGRPVGMRGSVDPDDLCRPARRSRYRSAGPVRIARGSDPRDGYSHRSALREGDTFIGRDGLQYVMVSRRGGHPPAPASHQSSQTAAGAKNFGLGLGGVLAFLGGIALFVGGAASFLGHVGHNYGPSLLSLGAGIGLGTLGFHMMKSARNEH